MKVASVLSLVCATAAFVLAPTVSMAVAGQRALMVFTGIFLWSTLFLYLLSKILPSGALSIPAGGPRPTGSGSSKFVDMEKQAIDYTKIQDLLR